MDGPVSAALSAAATAALNESDRTAHLANEFVHDISSSHEELEPVLIDLFGLSGILRQLRDVDFPSQLRPSLSRVIWTCSDICSCMSTVLDGCGEGVLRSRRWALTDAPGQIEGLKANLQNCMRTLEIAIDAVKM